MTVPTDTSEHLEWLESEAVHVIRETVAQFDNPVLMFSGGKDSLTMIHLARKAFYPAKVPFPILHVDTGHNFPETIEFRDNLMERHDLNLIVGSVEETIESGRAKEEQGPDASRNKLQIVTLLDTIEEHGFDAALGGARRDEEKARAKERFFSHRDRFGNWDPKNQRPELWNLYNGRSGQGEHFRVFPLSNWTELDVWQYIAQEGVEIPGLYLAHQRTMFERDGVLLPKSPYNDLRDGEHYMEKMVRFRTIGDMTCTGAVESTATTLDEVIAEVATTQQAERGARADDKRAEAAMEERKREGYF
ncbi:MAG: sulfate adenylyltransferase subunit CysD [Bacteroidetes bacterium QS_3_64_15]|nr:MAG: sulfate adenylyltransferase subunit CysD [Bacteroidetes bacterium QS_3_64_15]